MSRIAFITDGVFPQTAGGMARHSTFLVSHLARLGVEIEVFHPGPLPSFRDLDVSEVIVPWPKYRVPGHYILENRVFARRVARRISRRQVGFGAAYCQGLSMWNGMKALGIPSLMNPHGLEFLQSAVTGRRFSARGFEAAFRSAFREATAVVSLGGRLTEMLLEQGVSTQKLVVIPNGVDIAYIDAMTESGQRTEPPLLIFVGRLAFNKGLPELLDAFARLPRGAAKLAIVGEGELGEGLLPATRTPGVELLGRLDDAAMFSLLKSATCFVFPTKGEGMPTAILEAMACSLPVIATDVGAVRELVDEENGMLIQPGDSAALVTAMGKALAWPSAIVDQKGAVSRRRVEDRFSWPRVAQRTWEALEALIEREPVES